MENWRDESRSSVGGVGRDSSRPRSISLITSRMRNVPKARPYARAHQFARKKNLDAACVRPQKKGKLSTSRRSTRYRCFGQDLTELAGSWPCRTYPTAKIQPFSFSAKNFYRSRNEKSRPGAVACPAGVIIVGYSQQTISFETCVPRLTIYSSPATGTAIRCPRRL